MRREDTCSAVTLLQQAEELEPTYAAYDYRRRVLDGRSGGQVVDIARLASALGARRSAQALLVDLLARELRTRSADYRPGDVARRVLAPLGINIDARVSEYRVLITELLPQLGSLPAETTIRHRIAIAVPALDVPELATDCALAILAGRNLADASRDLEVAVETAAHHLREVELSWLESRLSAAAWDRAPMCMTNVADKNFAKS